MEWPTGRDTPSAGRLSRADEEEAKRLVARGICLQGQEYADQTRALALFRRAGELGNPEGYFLLGMAHYNGKGVALSADRAQEALLLAVKSGHVGASNWLLEMQRKGEGMPLPSGLTLKLKGIIGKGTLEPEDEGDGDDMDFPGKLGRQVKDAQKKLDDVSKRIMTIQRDIEGVVNTLERLQANMDTCIASAAGLSPIRQKVTKQEYEGLKKEFIIEDKRLNMLLNIKTAADSLRLTHKQFLTLAKDSQYKNITSTKALLDTDEVYDKLNKQYTQIKEQTDALDEIFNTSGHADPNANDALIDDEFTRLVSQRQQMDAMNDLKGADADVGTDKEYP